MTNASIAYSYGAGKGSLMGSPLPKPFLTDNYRGSLPSRGLTAVRFHSEYWA